MNSIPIDLRNIPLYFAYERRSINEEQYQGVFHAHQGVEILMVHEGRGTLIVGQRHYEIKPGLICVFQPFQLHHVQTVISEETPFVRSIVHYEPSIYEPFFESWPALCAFFKQVRKGKPPSPQYYEPKEMERLSTILLSLQESIASLAKDQYLEEFSLFLIVFFRAFKTLYESRHLISSTEQQSRKPHQAEKIMEWLDSHYKQPLRLEKLSKDLHLSPHHLSHLFKDCTGSTISDYLTAKRMQQAVLLLQSTDYAVSRIAEEVGFANSSHFCKLFKNHFGFTPYQFRMQWQDQVK